jgi:uncharacterized protein (TIGR03067 family)
MMRARFCSVAATIFMLVAVGCLPDGPKAGLDGVWAGVILVSREGKEDNSFAKTIRWTIKGDTIAISDARVQEAAHGTFKVADTTNPKEFDAKSKEGGGSFALAGIYEQDGDTLKVCYVPMGGGYFTRPTEFDAKSAIRLTLKRVAK